MWLFQSAWTILRQHRRRYLALNLLIYSGIVIGFLLGLAVRNAGGPAALPRWFSAGGQGANSHGLRWLIWLADNWLVLAGCFVAANLALVSLAILAGATWPPLLVPLGGWFGLELAGVTAIYVTFQPWSLVPLLPLLGLEAQAVILGLFIGWGLGARQVAWPQRVRAWGTYEAVYRLIPVLLLAAGLWEARIIAALVQVAGE